MITIFTAVIAGLLHIMDTTVKKVSLQDCILVVYYVIVIMIVSFQKEILINLS